MQWSLNDMHTQNLILVFIWIDTGSCSSCVVYSQPLTLNLKYSIDFLTWKCGLDTHLAICLNNGS